MKRKILIVFLTCLVVLAISGAGRQSEEGGGPSDLQLNPLGQLPLVNEKVTFEVFAQHPAYIVDWETNEFTVWYEEQTNVHLEWNVAPSESLNEKRSLLLASGDYPDFFMYTGLTHEEEIMYGEQGVFIRLNDMIEDHTVELKKVFSQRPYLRGALTTPNGNIYSMPALNECYHCWHAMRAYINKGWLDTLGLEVPQTTAEFYQVVKAFKTQDPNGNGQADEIAIMGATSGWQCDVTNFFINSFIYNHGGDRFYVNNGTVEVTYDKPEYREALRWLNKLYNEELIAPESFTQDDKQFLQIGSNPDAEVIGVGVASLWWSVVGQDGMINPDGTIRNRNYMALSPLEGPKGVRWAAYYPYSHETMLQITNECEHPEIIVRWADKIYNPDYTLYCNRGPNEGGNWRRATADEVGINSKPAIWVNLQEHTTDLFNDRWANMGTMFRSSDFRLGQAAPPDDPWESEVRLYNLSKEKYNPYIPDLDMIFPPVYMKADEVGELSRMKTTINDYVNESLVRFVTGDLDIEADWDGYLKELENMGLGRYVGLHQNAYDRQYK